MVHHHDGRYYHHSHFRPQGASSASGSLPLVGSRYGKHGNIRHDISEGSFGSPSTYHLVVGKKTFVGKRTSSAAAAAAAAGLLVPRSRHNAWTNHHRIKQLHEKVRCIPKGIVTHVCNAILAVLLLVWFLSNHETMKKVKCLSSSPTTVPQLGDLRSWRSCNVGWIYLSQFGLIYDNAVNAIGRYLGEGKLLRLLNKYRFVLHATTMPLLAIPVTEIAALECVYDTTILKWITTFLCGWSLIHLTKWLMFHPSDHLRVVDNRESAENQGIYLPGTLAYTSGAFWEMVLPGGLLLLYEFLVGLAIIVTKTCSYTTSSQGSFLCKQPSSLLNLISPLVATRTAPPSCCCSSSLFFLEPSSTLSATSSCFATTSWSAIYLILSGVLTLATSGMARSFPEIQLLGENLHSILLWAAYLARR